MWPHAHTHELPDQNRSNPPLQNQVETLKAYAAERSSIILFISRIDRSFFQGARSRPCVEDIRLPNPLDLALFNKAVFMRGGQIFVE